MYTMINEAFEGFEILHPTDFDRFRSLCFAFRTRRLLLAKREHLPSRLQLFLRTHSVIPFR